jgi:hypothetical protein
MPDRIQQEIEELLAKLETFPPKRSLWERVRNGIGGFRTSEGHFKHPVPAPVRGTRPALAIAAINLLAR